MPPIRLTQTVSSGDRPNLCRYPRRYGSISRPSPAQKTKRKVSKFLCRVSQTA
jgi:hypothetical protein